MNKNIWTLAIFILAPFLMHAQDAPGEGELIDTIDTSVDLFNQKNSSRFYLGVKSGKV